MKTLGPVPCETCGENLAGLDLEYHYGRNHHPKEPSRDEFKMSLRDSNLRIGEVQEAHADLKAQLAADGLGFARLRAVNVKRCVEGFGHTLDSWSVAEWANAMCGEAGEAANVAKKMLRHRDNMAGNKGADLDLEALRQKLGRELADTVIYLDLVCASQGLDLGQLVLDTFNAKSDEIGAKEKL